MDVPAVEPEGVLPRSSLRSEAPILPEVSENEVIRHFVALSQLNHHVDRGFYPLGSCTMKYNPKVNEEVVRLEGFAALHPYQPEETVQGALRLIHDLARMLEEIAGLDAITLQPAAGAQGEMTGILMIRAYLWDKGEERCKILIPDSAHGTNPASVTLAGFEMVVVPSDRRGLIDLEALTDRLDTDVAALMLTNPNTLGRFEEEILEISARVHEVGAQLYLDGANLNALLGIARPGDMGFDVVHFNLHKTFSVPHGGGGPGAGPLGVKAHLADYLPVPGVVRRAGGTYGWDWDRPRSIGKLQTFYGNFLALVRAYTYIRMLGSEGLRRLSEDAVLNANYVRVALQDRYPLVYGDTCLHECVLSAEPQKRQYGVRAMDIAKRLLDYGVHAPTVYFPLIVPEALMIEPSESETRESLDHFIAAMRQIDEEAATDPGTVKTAPHHTPVGRLDEAKAARELVLRWRPGVEETGSRSRQGARLQKNRL